MGSGRKLGWALTLVFLVCPAFGVMARPHPKTKIHRHKKQHKPTWFEQRVFVPSHENLRNQNIAIDDLGLERIKDKNALHELEDADALVPITENKFVRISPKLERDRRFCRPWVDMFLQELGQAYFDQFEEPIQVNSAVRTIKTQIWLLHWNRNAAPWHGETASAHLAGVAVDLQRRGLTRAQIHFIQKYLLHLSDMKMVIVEEELKQPCFHVVVTGDYPYPPPISVVPSNIDWEKLNGILNLNPTASPSN